MTGSALTAAITLALVVVIGARFRPGATRPVEHRAALDLNSGRWPDRVRALRRTEPTPTTVAAWCDEISRQVRSGVSLHESLSNTTPSDAATARATASVRLRLARGMPVDDALRPSNESPEVRLALDVIGIAARLSGSPAVALDRTAALLRQRAANRAERAAQAAQARLSAHVLTAVPLTMLGLLLTFDPDVVAAVLTPAGGLCIAVGLALNAAGWIWMRTIVGSPA